MCMVAHVLLPQYAYDCWDHYSREYHITAQTREYECTLPQVIGRGSCIYIYHLFCYTYIRILVGLNVVEVANDFRQQFRRPSKFIRHVAW